MIGKLKVGVWNIGFIKKNVQELLQSEKKYKIEWMKHNYHDRFFADPFLFSQSEKFLYILAEEYLFSEGKGRIVKLTVQKEDMLLVDNERIIEAECHLSYPFIHKDRIITEQYRSGRWVSYDFEGTEAEVLAEVGLIDATILDDGRDEWVFATRIDKDKTDAIKKLYRYKMVDGHVDLQSAMLIKDSLIASRPGGNFFTICGDWYRVAQTSTETLYGESIAICKIKRNTDKEYNEEPVMIIDSHNERRFNKGLHTFNPYEEIIIVDGFELQIHPIQKLRRKLKKRF